MSRTGVQAIEEGDELKLGVNLDPDEQANSFALVEETSHLVGSSGKPQTIGQSRNASSSFSRKWIDSFISPTISVTWVPRDPKQGGSAAG
jgi:hypothetical protein